MNAGGGLPACHSCPVLASVGMARDGVRRQCFPYFTNSLLVKARHSRAKIWSKPSVECCAYPARVLYVHFALAFFLSIFASHSSCFGLSKISYFFIPVASGTCGRFWISKRSPVHPFILVHVALRVQHKILEQAPKVLH